MRRTVVGGEERSTLLAACVYSRKNTRHRKSIGESRCLPENACQARAFEWMHTCTIIVWFARRQHPRLAGRNGGEGPAQSVSEVNRVAQSVSVYTRVDTLCNTENGGAIRGIGMEWRRRRESCLEMEIYEQDMARGTRLPRRQLFICVHFGELPVIG